MHSSQPIPSKTTFARAQGNGIGCKFQPRSLEHFLKGEKQPFQEATVAGLPDPAANVAGVSSELRDDIQNGTSNEPDFVHAVRLAKLVDTSMSCIGGKPRGGQPIGLRNEDGTAQICRSYAQWMYAWETALADRDTNTVVRPLE